MNNWKDIPIPQLMLDHCERDPRGLPVPFVVLKDKDGKHHFKINDTQKTLDCMMGGKCTICGQPMSDEDRWVVGGIASAFDDKGYYLDHPVHKVCGEYALQVCPYLAVRNYNAKIDMMKMQEHFKDQAEIKLHNPTIDPDRLPFFVFGRPHEIRYVIQGDDIIVVPSRPFLETEIWDEGKIITHYPELVRRLQGTKWEKYLQVIIKIPYYANQKA